MPVHTNLRSLKRREGLYTLIPGGVAESLKDRDLCSSCAAQLDCGTRKSLLRFQRKHSRACLFLKSCGMYQPPFVFVDMQGLEESFNTLRLGGAWANRVKYGDIVGLCLKHDKMQDHAIIQGKARVLAVECGDRDDIIRAHAHSNHLYKGKGMSPEAAGEAMAKLMPNLYGSLIWKNATKATVIYLERIE